MVEVYRWSPLPRGYIRLLEILAVHPQVSIRLRSVEEANSGGYYALSYAWGEDQLTEKILCESKYIKVTHHLRDALRHVSLTSGQKTFWVDAICINQEDEVEKASQVANIHNIFAHATAVLAWLGAADDESDRVISEFNRIKDRPSDLTDNPTIEDLSRVLFLPKSDDRFRLLDTSMYRPVVQLAKRLWFRRLWIAQEFIYAKHIVFFCGDSYLEADSFLKAIGKISIYTFGGVQPDDIDDDIFMGYQLLLDISKVRAAFLRHGSLPFFDAIMYGRKRDTSQPVDHIYAAIGLAQGSDTIYRQKLAIDYSTQSRTCYWNLYTTFGKVALLHEPQLKLLGSVSSDEHPTGLPSWCPNLNVQARTTAFTGIYSAGGPCKVGKDGKGDPKHSCEVAHPLFKGTSECHVQISDVSNSILITGTKVDVVCKVGQGFDWPFYNTDDLLESQDFARGVLSWFDQGEAFCSSLGLDKLSALWMFNKVIDASNNLKHKEDPKEMLSELEIYFWTRRILDAILKLQPDSSDRAQNSDLYEDFDRLSLWLATLQEMWSGRALFITDAGRVGFSTDQAKEGDLLCALYPGKTLYLLRPHPQKSGIHHFVEEAYCLEHMQGQVFELLHQGHIKEEVFVIE